MVEFCAERGLCVNNTYFEHKSLHKYIRVARDQDGLEVKSMIDLELVKKDMLRYVQDMRAVRGSAQKLRCSEKTSDRVADGSRKSSYTFRFMGPCNES